ncbi:Hypothetical_protein [Hexamita inflata]|uniref:Hypothetical_protein n=1 Tax=Hexamita inflata TaxID=28002 RepID=A0AA86N912_9EUKA|nr:Hypothetical protein HINF_LOCUS2743 [Hexamita inflata]
MSGMKGKQEQGQKKTQSVSQLVLKIEEQRQQINQMDTVFFETQDKCEELQNKLNAMQLQLQQAKSQALSNVKLDFDPHIVQLIKDVSFECDMNQQAIDALGLQFNDFVTIFNTFLPQDLELDTKNINFIRQIQLWEVELLFLVYYVSNYILKYFATSNADDKFQQIISSWRLFMNYSLTQEGQKYDFDRIRPQSTIQSRYLIFQKGKIEITTCNKRTAMTKINAVEDVQGRSTNSLNKLRQF